MPRLSVKTYINQHRQLRTSWLHFKGAAFAPLTPVEQLRLWTYYAPTLDSTPDELLEHRHKVTAQYKLLPQLAGRAYQRVLPYLQKPPAAESAKPKRGRRSGTVVVRSVQRAEVDSALLGRAIDGLVENDAWQAGSATATGSQLHTSGEQRSAK